MNMKTGTWWDYHKNKKPLRGFDRVIYANLIRMYKTCWFASKRKDKKVCREAATYMRRARLNHPAVFAQFVGFVLVMRHDLKVRKH